MGLEIGIPIFGKLFGALKQGKLANQINPQDVTYETNPYAKQNLGIIQQLFNARMPGAAAAGRQISANQVNTIANINRNATDSSTALALGMASQGEADQAANELAIREGQQKYGLLDNLSSAYKTLIGEGDKVYQDQLRKYQNDVEAKMQLRKAEWENYAGFGSDLASVGITALTGGFGKMGTSDMNIPSRTRGTLGRQSPILFGRPTSTTAPKVISGNNPILDRLNR